MPIPAAQPPVMTPDGEPRPCPRCGRIFERSIEFVLEGKTVRQEGHVPGDRVCRTVEPLGKGGILLDARARRAARAQL